MQKYDGPLFNPNPDEKYLSEKKLQLKRYGKDLFGQTDQYQSSDLNKKVSQTSGVLGQPRVVVIRKVVVLVHRLVKKALPDLVGPVLLDGPEGRLAVVVLVLRGLALDQPMNLEDGRHDLAVALLATELRETSDMIRDFPFLDQE